MKIPILVEIAWTHRFYCAFNQNFRLRFASKKTFLPPAKSRGPNVHLRTRPPGRPPPQFYPRCLRTIIKMKNEGWPQMIQRKVPFKWERDLRDFLSFISKNASRQFDGPYKKRKEKKKEKQEAGIKPPGLLQCKQLCFRIVMFDFVLAVNFLEGERI